MTALGKQLALAHCFFEIFVVKP